MVRLVWRFALLSLLSIHLAHGQRLDYREIESAVLDYRRDTTRRARIVLEARYAGPNAAPDSRYEIVADGSRNRWRYLRAASKTAGWEQVFHNILCPDYYIEDRGAESEVYAGPPTDYADIRDHLDVFYPRDVGMSTSALYFLRSKGMTSLMGRPDVRKATVSLADRNGDEVWRIEKTFHDGDEVTLWVSPSRGPSLVAATSKSRMKGARGGTYEGRLDVTLRRHTPGDIWYPETTEVEVTLNGQLYYRESVRVIEASFGGRIDPDEFELAGLGLPPGKRIRDRRYGAAEELIWDGAAAVRQEELGRTPLAARQYSWLWTAVAAACLIIGLGAAYRALR